MMNAALPADDVRQLGQPAAVGDDRQPEGGEPRPPPATVTCSAPVVEVLGPKSSDDACRLPGSPDRTAMARRQGSEHGPDHGLQLLAGVRLLRQEDSGFGAERVDVVPSRGSMRSGWHRSMSPDARHGTAGAHPRRRLHGPWEGTDNPAWVRRAGWLPS